MSLLAKTFDRLRRPAAAPPGDALYRAIVAVARAPDWYQAGAVPDTVDGRFDVVALVLALVLLRLEGDEGARQFSADLTERFIADMDGSPARARHRRPDRRQAGRSHGLGARRPARRVPRRVRRER